KRMISGLVLKYLNGECFVIRRGYETTLPVSSSFCLTVPVYDIVTAFLAGEERFLTGSPRGPFVRMSFGDIDGVSQGACGAVQIKMHPGAIRAYEDAGHTIADCLRP
ncbi:hypothetical protein N9F03_05815, partial [Planktomarina temperata]|nr:hypothetical protein [Planktomarina temperata]